MNMNPEHEQIKSSLYEKLAGLTSTMGAPVRLKLIQLLSQSPRTVEELSRESGESVANTSQHLQKLFKNGIITFKKEGLRHVYSIRNSKVSLLWESIQDLAEELMPEIIVAENELTDNSLGTSLSPENVLLEIKNKKAVLLDVRDRTESESTPVRWAKSVPLAELNEKIDGIPVNKKIYVFCRGRFCTLATDAMRILRSMGYEAYRLKDSSNRLNYIMEAL